MSSEEIQEIQEIQEIPEDKPVVPTRGRGRPKGAKNKVKILVVDTDIPAVTLSEPTKNEEAAVTIAEEPTKNEAAPIPKKPRASRTKRAQPAVTLPPEPIDPLPERRVSDHASPIASMMISLQEMRQERMAARKAMYRNMIA